MLDIRVVGVVVRQDGEGRFSINDLHRAAVAAGANARTKEPGKFLSSATTRKLLAVLEGENTQIPAPRPVVTVQGRTGGTYLCRELVYAYAMWVRPDFHVQVIRAFDAMVCAHAEAETPPYLVPASFAEALRLAAAQAERLEEQQRQLAAQQPAVDFVARYVDTGSTKSLREVVKVLGVREREFVQRLIDDGVCFRQVAGGRLLPKAEYQHQGLFAVFTGVDEGSGHTWVSMRFTPKGVTWAARRYARPVLALGGGTDA